MNVFLKLFSLSFPNVFQITFSFFFMNFYELCDYDHILDSFNNEQEETTKHQESEEKFLHCPIRLLFLHNHFSITVINF